MNRLWLWIAALSTVSADSWANGTMRAAIAHTPALSSIVVQNIALPKAGLGEVLIKIAASGVNPVDWKGIEAGIHGFPTGIGFDIAGVVEELGPLTSPRLKVGDSVWANIAMRVGAYAEYVAVPETHVGLKPDTMNFSVAATLPLVAQTSLLCLKLGGAPWTNKTAASEGTNNFTVVITSGTGGTGFVGVQMAKLLGAETLITAASTENIEWVKWLGADIVVDYTKDDIFDTLANQSVDVVFDNYGANGTANEAMRVLRKGGWFVDLAGGPDGLCKPPACAVPPGVNQVMPMKHDTSHESLDEVKAWIDAGQLRGWVSQSFSLDEVQQAFAVSKAGRVIGKLGITVDSTLQ